MSPIEGADAGDDPHLDCRSCGACCVVAGEVVVTAVDDVPRRMTRSVRGVVGFASWEADDFRRMARRPDGACAALSGSSGGRCSCRIYSRRPAVCRDFPVGGEACRAARASIGREGARR